MVSGPPAPLCPARRTQTRVSLLLWPLLVTCCRVASAQELPTNGVNGYSLHPPYFNLAEGTKITATATCGEEDTGRTVQDLYCKLVGGPVSGDPSQTIQVSGTHYSVVFTALDYNIPVGFFTCVVLSTDFNVTLAPLITCLWSIAML